MALLYTTTKHLHVTVVALSVGLFAVRGMGVLAGHSWPMASWVRRASMGMDTVLLSLGLTLWWQLGVGLAAAPWLAAKLALLVVYVILGSLALKRAPTHRARIIFLVLALATVGHMVTVALMKHPMGIWGGWAGSPT